MFYTYAHSKPDGTIFYIGKGKGARAWIKTKRNSYWKNTVDKYSKYNVEILAKWCTEKEALSHEIFLISCFKDMGYKLTNMTNGGEGTCGLKLTEAHKQKLREANLGVKNKSFGKLKSKETKEKISKTKIDQNLRGKNCKSFKGAILAVNIETGKEIKFEGTAELNAAGFQNPNVYKCINGLRKSHKGHTFKRLEK